MKLRKFNNKKKFSRKLFLMRKFPDLRYLRVKKIMCKVCNLTLMWATKLTINDNIEQESCTECLQSGVTYACTYVCTVSYIHTTFCKITNISEFFSLVSLACIQEWLLVGTRLCMSPMYIPLTCAKNNHMELQSLCSQIIQ